MEPMRPPRAGLTPHQRKGCGLLRTSHEISHTTETDDSPLTRVWLHEGEASGA
jgi:hypothetical protein